VSTPWFAFLFRHQRIDWVHIPRKDKKGGSNGETGFPSNSEPIYTFGDLIRSMKEMFNAIIGSKTEFFISTKEQFYFPSPYKMPDYFNNQERILDNVKFNTDEMVSNYNIYWALDIQDQNTFMLLTEGFFAIKVQSVR
jgi:hypothetical protein